MSHAASPPSSPAPLWKEPTQARGRARFDAILQAATDLMIEAGHLDVKMAAVAQRAAIPIGSLYQFFPSRGALLACLFIREMAVVDQSLQAYLERARSVDDLLNGFAMVLRQTVGLAQSRPGLAILWLSPGIDPAIQTADLENSKANAKRIADCLLALTPKAVDETAVCDAALLVCHLWGHVVRLSVLMADDGRGNGIAEQYEQMIRARLNALLA